jgi:hypothetical protein
MALRTTYTYSGVLITPSPGTTELAMTAAAGGIGFIERGHIEVWVSTDAFVSNETQLARPADFDLDATGTIVELATPSLAGQSYVVRRVTPLSPLTSFPEGGNITSQQLNTLDLTLLYRAQEAQDFNVDFQADIDSAVSDVDTALSAALSAQSDATTALADAATALSTANSASSAASSASSTASSAESAASAATASADAALAAVSAVLPFTVVGNVGAIPGSPGDGDVVEVTDSTGIQSFTPLAGVPGGFVGDAGLSVRIAYSSVGSTWNWQAYFANNPEDRYLAEAELAAGTGLDVTGSTYSLDAAAQASLALADSALQSADVGTAAAQDVGAFATAAQGTLADSALQPADVGTAAAQDVGAFATAAQGALADSAVQEPGIPVTGKTSAYSLLDADNGNTISITTGGVTVPNTLSTGTTVSIFNNSASSQTITQGAGLTMYFAVDGTTGNRTLAGRGWCTVSKIAAGVAVISGAGLS